MLASRLLVTPDSGLNADIARLLTCANSDRLARLPGNWISDNNFQESPPTRISQPLPDQRYASAETPHLKRSLIKLRTA
jgi:hypothetical protein